MEEEAADFAAVMEEGTGPNGTNDPRDAYLRAVAGGLQDLMQVRTSAVLRFKSESKRLSRADPLSGPSRMTQGCSLGEFGGRLRLLGVFASQMRMHEAEVAAPTTSEARAWAGRLAALLKSTADYYTQFSPTVAALLAAARAPVEKELRELVRLAKWEDRGYYAYAAAAEAHQRRLHKLARRFEQALCRPASEAMAAAAARVGFPEVLAAAAAADSSAGAGFAGRPNGKVAGAAPVGKRAKKHAPVVGAVAEASSSRELEAAMAAAQEAAAAAEEQATATAAADDASAWATFSSFILASGSRMAEAFPSAAPAGEAPAGYADRAADLAPRVCQAITAGLHSPAARTSRTAGAVALEAFASMVLSRAAELRASPKTPRAVKKKVFPLQSRFSTLRLRFFSVQCLAHFC